MKTITIDGKDYTLEFSFDAAENRELVQKMFNVVSGAYLVKNGKFDENGNEKREQVVGTMIDGVSEMVSEIPHICITAFYAGLLENNPQTKEDAKNLMKSYMKENKISFNKLFDEIKDCMEDDGFFDLSGLTEMVQKMNENIEKETEKEAKKTKQPQDHKKPTSTK